MDSPLTELAADILRRWREDPRIFVRELWGVEPDAWQDEVLRIFPSQDPEDMRIAMQACVGVGKGAVMAWCGWNFLLCYVLETGRFPNGALLAPTKDQLRDSLWKEYAVWRQKSELLTAQFEMTADTIFERNNQRTWFLSARSYPKDADAETVGRTLSGLHADCILFQIDESATVPVEILKAAEQGRSGAKWFKVMQAGNPTCTTGALYAAATKYRSQWHLIIVTGDPNDPQRSPRISLEMANDAIKADGIDDPWVMAHILGKFPPGGINTLLTPDEVETAMARAPRAHEYSDAARIIGCDVAREGLDKSVIFQRQGIAAFTPVVRSQIDGSEGAGLVARIWQDENCDACFIDNTGGFGGSWLDHLRNWGFSPVGVHFSGTPEDKRFLNKRSEMYFRMRDWIRDGGAIPAIPRLAEELLAITYHHKGDKYAIEEKASIKRRLKFSPDYADALCLCFAFPVEPGAGRTHGYQQTARVLVDYDPYGGNP